MRYINYEERKMIEKMLNQGMSKRTIARLLRRSHSTIIAEIKRNSFEHEKRYSAEEAERRFLKKQLRKGNVSKLARDAELKNFVIEKIVYEQWSPDLQERAVHFLGLVVWVR